MQNYLRLSPITYVHGTINLPGSKSISNRALLLAAMAKGTTRLINLLNSHDVKHMLNALKLLNINYKLSHDRTICDIFGNSGPLQSEQSIELFLGNAGTVMRPLTAVLSLVEQSVILTGEQRMLERPIGHLVDSLRQGKAKINYLEKTGYPPLHLYGGFIGGEINIDGNISSQFLTSLLIAAPLAKKDTFIIINNDLVSKPYIDITLNLMRCFHINISNENYKKFIIKGKQQYHSPVEYLIEGDATSASYFLAAAAIKGGTVKVNGINNNSIQGDIYFAEILKKMGALIKWENNSIICSRNVLNAIDMDMNNIPDAAMTIAIIALFAKGTTIIRNIYNWRVKETDRLAAMATELRKVGAKVKEGHDFICITPPKQLKHAIIDTYNDHRMAMCFSLLALSDVSVTIINPDCTSKTFPNYFQCLAQISHVS
ncbi:3-phosphoshikimate 1-carboxyvinyltransferase [Pantoea sp. Mhis]|uniref:3-phosphoshikimate 1-carboxyvinyltransferase n=1 Tax=Pantoea sp. Mhis TaxID=2576759 RepID=UPI00135B836E|nr:3-phosphoshikimate 1-carboxyvinyltransferase [Pantoea sp. Mhis]MXP56128.1 3-phosphoshikimate 1-carboxyvinyltransferase [Pantoea sp. Mhis]